MAAADQPGTSSQDSKMLHMREWASDVKLNQEVGNEEQHLQPSLANENSKGRGNNAWVCWGDYVKERISSLLAQNNLVPGFSWTVTVKHIEHVKSYAPHIDHLVADLECRPQPTSLD